eukprot:g7751.t1
MQDEQEDGNPAVARDINNVKNKNDVLAPQVDDDEVSRFLLTSNFELAVVTSIWFYFGLAYATYLMFIVPLEAMRLAPQNQILFLSVEKLIYGVSLVSAPFFGHYSDETRSKFGKRRIWILSAGVLIFVGNLTSCLASVRLDCGLWFFGVTIGMLGKHMSAATHICRGNFALLADLVPKTHSGTVAAFVQIQCGTGAFLGFLGQFLGLSRAIWRVYVFNTVVLVLVWGLFFKVIGEPRSDNGVEEEGRSTLQKDNSPDEHAIGGVARPQSNASSADPENSILREKLMPEEDRPPPTNINARAPRRLPMHEMMWLVFTASKDYAYQTYARFLYSSATASMPLILFYFRDVAKIANRSEAAELTAAVSLISQAGVVLGSLPFVLMGEPGEGSSGKVMKGGDFPQRTPSDTGFTSGGATANLADNGSSKAGIVGDEPSSSSDRGAEREERVAFELAMEVNKKGFLIGCVFLLFLFLSLSASAEAFDAEDPLGEDLVVGEESGFRGGSGRLYGRRAEVQFVLFTLFAGVVYGLGSGTTGSGDLALALGIRPYKVTNGVALSAYVPVATYGMVFGTLVFAAVLGQFPADTEDGSLESTVGDRNAAEIEMLSGEGAGKNFAPKGVAGGRFGAGSHEHQNLMFHDAGVSFLEVEKNAGSFYSNPTTFNSQHGGGSSTPLVAPTANLLLAHEPLLLVEEASVRGGLIQRFPGHGGASDKWSKPVTDELGYVACFLVAALFTAIAMVATKKVDVRRAWKSTSEYKALVVKREGIGVENRLGVDRSLRGSGGDVE